MYTRSVDIMLSRPGIYVLVGPVSVAFCEVEPGGKCHQLRPGDFTRDGELRPGGWNLDGRFTAYGPLVRPPAADPHAP